MTTATSGTTSTERASPVRADHERALDDLRAARPRRVLLWVPAALVLVLGLVGLDRHSVWRDEAASLVAAQRSLPELLSMLGHIETVHALYYTLLHGWLQLGSGEVWARVPSVLAMAVAAGLVGVVGARLASVGVGLVGGLLFAVNPAVSYYAQEARSTALVAASALLATWFLLRSLDRRSSWWVGYALTCAALVGLNLLALLVPVAHALTLLVRRDRRRALRSWAVAVAPALVVALVLVLLARRQPYQIGWIGQPGLDSVRGLVILALGPNLPVAALVGALALLGALPGRSGAQRRLRAFMVPSAVLPAAVLLATSLVQPIFVPRYVFPSVAAVSLLAGLGVVRLAHLVAARRGRPATGLVVAAAVLVVAVGGVGTQRLDRTAASRSDDLAGAAATVAAGARPGDAVVFLPSNQRLVALVYPQAFHGLRDVGLGAGPVEAGNLTGRPLPVDVTLRNISASDRVWAVGRPGLALLPSDRDARTELALLDRDFVVAQRPAAHGVGIRLYARRHVPS